jgi:hypothetical protein
MYLLELENNKAWISPEVNFRAFAFLTYNDSILHLNTSSIPIKFADDISVIISSKNLDDFCILPNKVPSQMSKWFSENKLSLNLDKTNVIKFKTNNSPQYLINIGYNDRYIRRGSKPKIPWLTN